jgi:2-methylcitrate dehydratase
LTTLIEQIGGYSANLRSEDIPAAVLDYAKRLFLDALACMYAGVDSAPVKLAYEVAAELGGKPQATLLNTGEKMNAQQAALINGVALRFPDFNDIYYGPAWAAHPSDSTAALLAIAEWQRKSGMELLLAMIATYEVQLRFSDLPAEKNLWHRGWQHTAPCAYASAAGVAKLLGLTAEQTAHAMALSGARTNTFSEIRRGKIAMDKAMSEPLAASASVYCAMLAKRGFTSCLTVLEGPYGLKHAVAGGIDVSGLLPQPGDFRILRVAIKPYPVQGMTPAMVQAALELRAEHNLKAEDIQSLQLFVPQEALTKPSWDAKKLAPDSKETADHSFHYCVAVALVAGKVTALQFEPEWLNNTTVHAVMSRISLIARDDLTNIYKQGACPAAMEIKTRSTSFYCEVLQPKGAAANPMNWAEVRNKFMSQAAPRLGEGQAAVVADRVQIIEREQDMADFVRLLIPAGPVAAGQPSGVR